MNFVIMGNKPSTILTLVTLSETTKLEENVFNYLTTNLTILKNTFVDNKFRVAPNSDRLHSNNKEIKTVCSQGGFLFKELIISGQHVPDRNLS